MWKFWAILAAALLAGGIYVIAETRKPAPAPEPAPPITTATPPPAPVASKPVPAPVPVVEPKGGVAATSTPPAAATPAPEPTPMEPVRATMPADDATPEDHFTDMVPGENATPDLTPPAPETPTSTATPKPVLPEPAPENLKKLGEFFIIPGTVEKKADGSLLLDGKYLLKGEGTPEKPYIVSWDLLTSAEEAFDPQNGKRRLPERVAMLDGKHVRLAGHIAFPMTTKEPRELLSMLNQWDGCCIGTPPTPYDAVEVSLTEAVVGDDRFATTGKVVGTFHVKPFLQGDWLIGLYVMEDAKLTPRDFGGAGAN
jgi:hypothetical protein